MFLKAVNELKALTPDIVRISTITLKLEQDIIRNRFLFNFYICSGAGGTSSANCDVEEEWNIISTR